MESCSTPWMNSMAEIFQLGNFENIIRRLLKVLEIMQSGQSSLAYPLLLYALLTGFVTLNFYFRGAGCLPFSGG
jgi:hypothetical protein